MRRWTLFSILWAAVGSLAPLPAVAGVCESGPRPAATLLLPYFEVDSANPSGVNTTFDVTNVSYQPVLTKVEVWSDLGVALFGFNIYLGSYDTQRVNLGSVLGSGILPTTAAPAGPFPSCAGALPPAAIPAATLAQYQRSLRGLSSSLVSNLCMGVAYGDTRLRGYVTVDTVSSCSLRYQGDPGYWASGGFGDATNQNQLVGSYHYTDATRGVDQGEPMVHIEADASSSETSVAGNYTFYGKFTGWTAADNREPLPTTFAARYYHRPARVTSDLVIWRDSKVNTNPFACPAVLGTRPSWYGLGRESGWVFDESGAWNALPAQLAPAVAQRIPVGGAQLPVSGSSGWFFLNLNHNAAAAGAVPPEDPSAAQAWVTVLTNNAADRSIGFAATAYDSACVARHAGP